MEAQERWPVRQQRGLRWGRRVSLEGRKYFREKIFQAAEQAQHGAAARAALMAVNVLIFY